MKLIVLQPYLNLRGGAERVVLKIADHYKAKIYTLEYDRRSTFDKFKDLDVEIIGREAPLSSLLPYRASQGLRYGYNFYNLKIREDYDVINPHLSPSEWVSHKNGHVLWYCHTPPREVYDQYATRMQNRPYREKLLYAAMTGAYKMMAGRLINRIDKIATNSSTTRERIKRYYGRDATVINPGIDYELFSDNGDDKFFYYPSRIVINKRQDYVIQAFKHFTSKRGRRDYRLVLAGTLSKDPEHVKYYERLKAMSKGMNVAIKTNVGEEELLDLYSSCTAVLFSAANEDYGFIPLEAMASSKPIISVNEGGPADTIENGRTGFLVGSPREMGDRMLEIAKSDALASKMGRAGRRRVMEKYSWSNFFKKFDLALKEVAKE